VKKVSKRAPRIGHKYESEGRHTEILLMFSSSKSAALAVHANAPRSAADSDGNHMMKLYPKSAL
jgi:hypothetical protein